MSFFFCLARKKNLIKKVFQQPNHFSLKENMFWGLELFFFKNNSWCNTHPMSLDE